MLEWLKRVTQYEPRPTKIIDIEAKLKDANGGPMYGEIEYEQYEDGNWELEIEIEHANTQPEGPFDIRLNGKPIASVPVSLRGFDTEKRFTSKAGDTLHTVPNIGAVIEVRTPTGILLTGSFEDKLRGKRSTRK